MPRLPKFDRDQVLNSAMEVFWVHGYEASSIQKLLDAMEINRGSLYASFGDKATLFQEVISRYSSMIRCMTTQTLVAVGHPLRAIRLFFHTALIHDPVLASKHGCMLFNTVSELIDIDPSLAESARQQIEAIRDVLLERLVEAKHVDLIEPDRDIEVLADLLVAMVAGLRLQSKMGASPQELAAMIDTGLSGLGLDIEPDPDPMIRLENS